jgi:hypothetical protein
LTYSFDATGSEPLSDAIPPPAEKVKRTPLDNNARDRIDVAEHPESPPRRFFLVYRLVGSTRLPRFSATREIQASEAKTHLPQLLDDVEREERP